MENQKNKHEKIVYIVTELNSAIHFRRHLLEAASRKFKSVYLLTSINCKIPKSISNNIKLIDIPARRTTSFIRDIFYFIRILNHLKKIGPVDVVHTFSAKPNIYGILASRIVNVPKRVVSITGLGRVILSPNKSQSLFKIILLGLYRLSFYFATDIWFQNNSNWRYFHKISIIPQHVRVHIIFGSGIDISFFSSMRHKETTNIRNKFLISENELLVICVSRLLKSKGVHLLLESIPLLDKNIRVILIGEEENGNGPEFLRYDDVRKAFNGTKHIYLNYSNDLRSFIYHSDIAFLPSYGEGISKFLMESISMEKFILTSNAPGCIDLFEFENSPGLQVELNSKCISKTLNNLHQQNRKYFIRPKNRQLAEKYFDINIVNKKILKIYS